GHDRLPLAHEDSKAKILVFGPFRVLELAEAPGEMLRLTFEQDGVRRVGTGGLRSLDQILQEIAAVVGCEKISHAVTCSCWACCARWAFRCRGGRGFPIWR